MAKGRMSYNVYFMAIESDGMKKLVFITFIDSYEMKEVFYCK